MQLYFPKQKQKRVWNIEGEKTREGICAIEFRLISFYIEFNFMFHRISQIRHKKSRKMKFTFCAGEKINKQSRSVLWK